MEFDVSYDVVVLGGGASGKSAAYTVASKSDLSVALLEKQPQTGGTSRYAEGTGASESPEQIKRGVPDYPGELPEGAHFPTREEHYQRFIDYSHHRANPDVVRAFVWNSGDTIQMLSDIGVEWTFVSIYAYDQPNEVYTFHRPDGLGERVQELLLRACINEGVEIFTSTPAKELIFDNDKIVGVKAVDVDGNEISVGAKAVVLATGGFGDDRDFVDTVTWIPNLGSKVLPSRPGIDNVGDGLRMAISAGGDTSNLGTVMVSSRIRDKTMENPLARAAFQPTLWLNSRGERFYNEAVAHSFSDFGDVVAQLDDGELYILHAGKTIKRIEEMGSDIGLGDFLPYKAKVPGIPEAAKESMDLDEGVAWIADSIEELAKLVGLDVEKMTAAVERYNELCVHGKDEDILQPLP